MTNMCNIIYTKSVHCDDPCHTISTNRPCKKNWFRSWEYILKCKKRREFAIEIGEDCQLCEEASQSIVESWEEDGRWSIDPEMRSPSDLDMSDDDWPWSDGETEDAEPDTPMTEQNTPDESSIKSSIDDKPEEPQTPTPRSSSTIISETAKVVQQLLAKDKD